MCTTRDKETNKETDGINRTFKSLLSLLNLVKGGGRSEVLDFVPPQVIYKYGVHPVFILRWFEYYFFKV